MRKIKKELLLAFALLLALGCAGVLFPVRAGIGNGIPPAANSSLGGVFQPLSQTHKFFNALDSAGNFALSQPICGDLFDGGTGCTKNVFTATTAAIGGGALAAGACATGTATSGLTGVTTAMTAMASPSSDPQVDSTHGVTWEAWVSSANTATVRVCAIVATTPTSVTYNVRVIQ